MFNISKKIAVAILIFVSGQFNAFGSNGENEEFSINGSQVLNVEGPEVIIETGASDHSIEKIPFCIPNDPNRKCLHNDVVRFILSWSFIDQVSFNAEEHFVARIGQLRLMINKEDASHIKNLRLVCKGFYQYVNSKVTIFSILNPYGNPKFVDLVKYDDECKMLIDLLRFRPNLKVLKVENCTFFSRDLLCETISRCHALKALEIWNSNITDDDLINFTNRFDGDLIVALSGCNTITEAVFARLSVEKKNRKIFFHISGCENVTRGLTVDPNSNVIIKQYYAMSGCSIC
jgi:hypothetical protein